MQGPIGAGWMLVQTLTNKHIRVEYFTGATTRPTAFTGAAQEYVRYTAFLCPGAGADAVLGMRTSDRQIERLNVERSA